MKKIIPLLTAIILLLSAFSAFATEYTIPVIGSNVPETTAVDTEYTIPKSDFEDRDIAVILNGEKVDFTDAEPVLYKDRSMLPLRRMCECFGAEVYYQECPNDIHLITLRRDLTLVTLINAEYFAVDTIVGGKWRFHKYNMTDSEDDYVSIFFNDENGKAVIDPEPIMLNDRTLVPLRLFAEAFGATVGWDDATSTVFIEMPKAVYVRTPEQIEADTNYTYQDAIKYGTDFLKENGLSDDTISAVVCMVNNLYNVKGKIYAFDLTELTSEYKSIGFYADGSHTAFKK